MLLLWRHPLQEIVQKIIQFIVLQFLSLSGLCAMAVLLLAAVSICAQDNSANAEKTTAQTQGIGGGRSLSESVRWVYQQTGGRILSVESVPAEGQSINRVKYMDIHGRVRYMDDVDNVPESPSPDSDGEGG